MDAVMGVAFIDGEGTADVWEGMGWACEMSILGALPEANPNV